MNRNSQRGVSPLVMMIGVALALLVAFGWVHYRDKRRHELLVAEQLAEAQAAAAAEARSAAVAAQMELSNQQEQRRNEEQAKSTQRERDLATHSLLDLSRRWADAATLAGGTPRIALSGPVGNMQAIRRETASLYVPACMAEPKAKLVAGMDALIEGYGYFMRDADFGKIMVEAFHSTAARLAGEFASALRTARC